MTIAERKAPFIAMIAVGVVALLCPGYFMTHWPSRIARERDEIDPPVRIHPFKAHLVVCRIEDDETIFVVRIRHAHEDWATDSI